MIDWCKRHPVGCMMGYLVLYLCAFHQLEVRNQSPQLLLSCAIDHWIPFWKYGVIPYLLWFVWVPGTLLVWLRNRPREEFWRLCLPLFGGMALCLGICALVPNGVALRPDHVPGDDLFSHLVQAIWQVDTSTNVCPSIHAFNSMTVDLCYHRWGREHNTPASRAVVLGMHLLNLSILASTVLLKQHSVIDLVCGVGLALVVDGVASYVTRHREILSK